MTDEREEQLDRFRVLSTALLDEIGSRRASDSVASLLWPTIGALAGHVTSVYRWVTDIVRTGRPAERHEAVADDDVMVEQLRDARDSLLSELARDDQPCWVIGGATGSTVFWRRRMVHESLKHLLDARTRPFERFDVPPELDALLAADGIDEFFTVFLARSAPTLEPLPGAVLLGATDIPQTWRIDSDWSISALDDAATVIEAPVVALLLMLWERANALEEPERFAVSGNHDVARAFHSAPKHP